MIKKITRFVKAFIKHFYNRFPKSTQQEIDYRMNICEKCDFFDAVNSECLQCGCNLSRKQEFFNKLAWADQQCPIEKW